MRSDTAAQTGATLFFTVLMTVALIAVDQTGQRFGTARFPSARVDDVYDVLRLRLDLADRLGEARERLAPPKAAVRKDSMARAIRPTAPSVEPLAPRDSGTAPRVDESDPRVTSAQRDGSTADGVRRGEPDLRRNDPSGPAAPTRPREPARRDDGGRSGPETHGRGRDRAAGGGVIRDQTKRAPTGTADTPGRRYASAQRDRTPARRDHKVKPGHGARARGR